MVLMYKVRVRGGRGRGVLLVPEGVEDLREDRRARPRSRTPSPETLPPLMPSDFCHLGNPPGGGAGSGVRGQGSRPQTLSTKLPGNRPVRPFLWRVPLNQPSSRFRCTKTTSPSFSSSSASLWGG